AEHYHPIREPIVGQQHLKNGQVLHSHRPSSEQALVSTINNNKQVNLIKQPKGRQTVIDFFIENKFNADEANKFFDLYQDRDWKTGDGKPIRDWRALAIHWMDRAELFNQENKLNKKQGSQIKDNLRTTKNKDYGQPL
ncbi:hypothetical protein FT986_05855, partial [Mesonia sp. K4-1]